MNEESKEFLKHDTGAEVEVARESLCNSQDICWGSPPHQSCWRIGDSVSCLTPSNRRHNLWVSQLEEKSHWQHLVLLEQVVPLVVVTQVALPNQEPMKMYAFSWAPAQTQVSQVCQCSASIEGLPEKYQIMYQLQRSHVLWLWWVQQDPTRVRKTGVSAFVSGQTLKT